MTVSVMRYDENFDLHFWNECVLNAYSILWKQGLVRELVKNVKKLYHASLLGHGLFTWFNDFITMLRLIPTHNSRLIRKETYIQCPVLSTWNSAIHEAIKRVPHTCLFGYV